MDERNIHGLIISVLIIIGLIIVLFFIVNNDRKRVDSLTVEEIENKNVEEEPKKEEEKKEEEKETKELSNFTSFELSYTTDSDPISSYSVSLNSNKELISHIDENCPKESECVPLKEDNNVILSDEDYKIVIDLYNRLYTEEWANNSKGSFVVLVSKLSMGDGELYNNTSHGWTLYQKYDKDNDGIVSYSEFAKYSLENF